MSQNNQQGNVMAGAASQWISIVAENGEQFVAGQKIIYNIEPEIGYIKKDSYIVFDVLNTSPDKNRVCFPRGVGAHALIENVNIYSKETGVLLESLQNYSQWRIIEHQYLNDDTKDLAIKEGVGEPVQSFQYDGGAQSGIQKEILVNPHPIENNVLSPVDTTLNPKYTSTRFCIPLKTGLMGHMDNDPKLIPVLNFGGLRIEITLAKNQLALQHLGQKYNQTPNTVGGISRSNVMNAIAEDGAGNLGCGLKLNNSNDADETFGAFTAATSVFIRLDNANNVNYQSLADCGLAVGNKLKLYTSATPAGTDRTAIGSGDGGVSEATIVSVVLSGSPLDINGNNNEKTITITTNVALNGFQNVNAGLTHWVLVKSANISYKVTKTEFRLCQITPPQEQMNSLAKGLNYEFTSYDTFLNNIPTSSLRHQIPINSVASKALAMFSLTYDNVDMENINHQSYYYGLPPEASLVNDVVWFINNRLYPLRSYNPQAKNDKVLTLNELNKALKAIGKNPLSLGSNEFGDIEGYTNTFLLCRELAREGFVFDLRNAEPEIRIAFSAGRPSVLRVNTFVFSKRIIQTTAQGVQVIY